MAQGVLDKIAGLDQKSMLFAARLHKPWLTVVLKIFTYSGTGKFWLRFALVLGLFNLGGIHIVPEQSVFLHGMLSALIAWGLATMAKKSFPRMRPSARIENYHARINVPVCSSFPSGHAAASVAFFVALVLLGHPWAIGVGIWAAIVTFSRFYLGVHFPSDLLGGSVLGVLCGLLIRVVDALL